VRPFGLVVSLGYRLDCQVQNPADGVVFPFDTPQPWRLQAETRNVNLIH
jgi:hypothetical protein